MCVRSSLNKFAGVVSAPYCGCIVLYACRLGAGFNKFQGKMWRKEAGVS